MSSVAGGEAANKINRLERLRTACRPFHKHRRAAMRMAGTANLAANQGSRGAAGVEAIVGATELTGTAVMKR